MENKYYAPEIEEFHVGFEFEIISLSSNNYKEDKSDCEWNTRVLKTEHLYSEYKEDSYLETVLSYLKNGYVRVKYLDEQNILDLGFEKIQETKMEIIYKRPDSNFGIYFYPDYRRKVLIFWDVNDTYEGCIFDGYIKNKSELKKILKMVIK